MLVTREHGYELELDPECLDSHRFELLVAEARAESAAGLRERASMLGRPRRLLRTSRESPTCIR